jgi:hypothetical protein
MGAGRRRLKEEVVFSCAKSAGLNPDSVKSLRVGRQNRFFVGLRQILSREQLINPTSRIRC